MMALQTIYFWINLSRQALLRVSNSFKQSTQTNRIGTVRWTTVAKLTRQNSLKMTGSARRSDSIRSDHDNEVRGISSIFSKPRDLFRTQRDLPSVILPVAATADIGTVQVVLLCLIMLDCMFAWIFVLQMIS